MPATPRLVAGCALAAFLVLSILVATGRTNDLDAVAYDTFRPSGVWGEVQQVNEDLVRGLRPSVTLSLVALAALAASLRRRSLRPLRAAATLVVTTAIVTVVTKALVLRTDTSGSLAELAGSFPSGHAASITVSVFGLVLVHRVPQRLWEWTGLLLAATVLTVPILVIGLHWLTDVAGGILMGLAVSALHAAPPPRPRTGALPDQRPLTGNRRDRT